MRIFIVIISILLITACQNNVDKHLFILAGQSNMSFLDPNESFIPTLEKEFNKDEIIVVKFAKNGSLINKWYNDWIDENGFSSDTTAYLYENLLSMINSDIESEEIISITFLWMQGESDAREGYGYVYENSLIGLYTQISEDLNRNDINFIIGRLSDFDLKNEKFSDWSIVRDAQVRVANSNEKFDWVDTDDLNDGIGVNGELLKNDLHYSEKGYEEFGVRLAQKAIDLINTNFKN